MKLPLPLSLKVSLWLLLNLLLLVLAGVLYLGLEFGLSWESLVSRQAVNRLEGVGRFVFEEKRRDPSGSLDGILSHFSTAYGADLYLYSQDGRQLAGPGITLPSELAARLSMPLPRGMRGSFPPGPPAGFMPEGDKPMPSGSLPPPPLGDGPDPFGRMHRQIFFRGGSPVSYWIGVRVLLPGETGEMGQPAVLFAMTKNVGGAGLLYDLRPWILGGCLMLGISILFWLPFVGSITRAIREMTVATERIAQGQFETKVRCDRADELGRLGEAINAMTGRLNGFVTGQKRFLGDVAHELGSPLGRLQMAIGILEERTDPSLQAHVSDVREEVQHMSDLVAELLAFTKAGLGGREIALLRVELAPLVSKVVTREAAGDAVVVSVPPGLFVEVVPDLLSRAIGNLVRNAVRYAGSRGAIQVQAQAVAGEVIIRVVDEGPGVPPEALPFLGDPFYRPAVAREREAGGTGLGLSIVRTAVSACKGRVRYSNRIPHGFLAEIILPDPRGQA